jgi:hypothetical protein
MRSHGRGLGSVRVYRGVTDPVEYKF